MPGKSIPAHKHRKVHKAKGRTRRKPLSRRLSDSTEAMLKKFREDAKRDIPGQDADRLQIAVERWAYGERLARPGYVDSEYRRGGA